MTAATDAGQRRSTATDAGERCLAAVAGSERGSATVVGVAAVLALLAAIGLGLQLGAAVVTRHRAEAAADLAALAAAATAANGAPAACAAAGRVANGMAVRIASCELHGWQASVQVEATPPGALGRIGTARATARAGPAATEPTTDGDARRAVGRQRQMTRSRSGRDQIGSSVATSATLIGSTWRFAHVYRVAAADRRQNGSEPFRCGGGRSNLVPARKQQHMETRKMDWTNTWRNAFRTELRAEAIGLAYHGWPVVPGTYPDGTAWVGRAAAAQHGPVPLHDNWIELASASPDKVAALWSGRPFSLLLATGLVYDALDLSAAIGRCTAAELRNVGFPAPIAATPTGRWLFPVIAGEPLCAELADHPEVVLHGLGSWIPLPPSPFVHGVVHWRVKPEVSGWHVPRSTDVQQAVLDALYSQRPTEAGTGVLAATTRSHR